MIRELLELESQCGSPRAKLMLAHGRTWAKCPDTYEGPRGEPHGCFANAAHMALEDAMLTYVEGYVETCGIPIEHAWCIDEDGFVIDPTIVDGEHIGEYYGVPFDTGYLGRTLLREKVYGVLTWNNRRVYRDKPEQFLAKGGWRAQSSVACGIQSAR